MSRHRNPHRIDRLVIHCSASANGEPLTAAEIDAWHKARGFRRDPKLIGYHAPQLRHIGYHYVIRVNGPVEVGRALRETGAHAKGFNVTSIGTCMIGTDKFTAAQWQSLAKHVEALQRELPNLAHIVGHRDLSPDADGDGTVEPHEWLKTCPGFSVADWLAAGRVAPADHLLEATP